MTGPEVWTAFAAGLVVGGLAADLGRRVLRRRRRLRADRHLAELRTPIGVATDPVHAGQLVALDVSTGRPLTVRGEPMEGDVTIATSGVFPVHLSEPITLRGTLEPIELTAEDFKALRDGPAGPPLDRSDEMRSFGGFPVRIDPTLADGTFKIEPRTFPMPDGSETRDELAAQRAWLEAMRDEGG